MQHYQRQALDQRLRTLLEAMETHSYSVEEVALILRGEVVASFFRGQESMKKRLTEVRRPVHH